MNRKQKKSVLKRALEIVRNPNTWSSGTWLAFKEPDHDLYDKIFNEMRITHGIEGITHGIEGAYAAGRVGAFESDEPVVCACVQGAIAVACGEQGLSFDAAYELIGDLEDGLPMLAANQALGRDDPELGAYDDIPSFNDNNSHEMVVKAFEAMVESATGERL